jgi:hypothetical protein
VEHVPKPIQILLKEGQVQAQLGFAFIYNLLCYLHAPIGIHLCHCIAACQIHEQEGQEGYTKEDGD